MLGWFLAEGLGGKPDTCYEIDDFLANGVHFGAHLGFDIRRPALKVSGTRTLWGRGRPVISGSRPMSTRRRPICKWATAGVRLRAPPRGHIAPPPASLRPTRPLGRHSSSLEATRALMPESPIETSARTSSRMRRSRAVTSVENMWLIQKCSIATYCEGLMLPGTTAYL
jgi:hypothetical protein